MGKSTVLSHITSTYSPKLVQVHREPVENWMNINGFDLLNALYTDSNRWTFAFEISALLARIKNHSNALNNNRLNIFERSLLSCFQVFIRHDLEQKYLNDAEYRILQDHFEFGVRNFMDLSSTAILYFDLPPKECYDRILKRSRPSEISIDMNRLEQLKFYYDDFIYHFKACPVHVIDTTQSIEQTCQQVDAILNGFLRRNQQQQTKQ